MNLDTLMTNQNKFFVDQQKEFLSFLRTRFALYDQSNLFFRDLHYGIMGFLEMQGHPLNYTKAEYLTNNIVALLEEAKILVRMDDRTWMLNYPSFRKIPVKPAASARPANLSPKPAPSIPVPTKAIAEGAANPTTSAIQKNDTA